MTTYEGLSACFINCSLNTSAAKSHTMRLVQKAAAVMRSEGVEVDVIHARDHAIGFGMAKDTSTETLSDDWPQLQERVLAADILVIASPIWLGVKSSVASLVVERLYAYSADNNDRGQYVYYGRAGGCIVTGNEDGVKAVAMETLYALSHIGYAIPPQADSGWIGEVGPGASYGDEADGNDVPTGYDNDFTNRNTTFMAWNLMHMSAMLKANGGIPALGKHRRRLARGFARRNRPIATMTRRSCLDDCSRPFRSRAASWTWCSRNRAACHAPRLG